MELTTDYTLPKKKISKPEDFTIATIQNETQRETLKNGKNISESWDNFKQPKISVTSS